MHHHKGTFVRADDFEPLTTALKPNGKQRFAPPAGRPLGHVFPYLNLETQAGEGVIAVVGWPGQWAAEFARDDSTTVRLFSRPEHYFPPTWESTTADFFRQVDMQLLRLELAAGREQPPTP